jgi:hypothetical protein
MYGCCITAALRAMRYVSAEMSWHGFRALASNHGFTVRDFNPRPRIGFHAVGCEPTRDPYAEAFGATGFMIGTPDEIARPL